MCDNEAQADAASNFRPAGDPRRVMHSVLRGLTGTAWGSETA